MNEVWILNHIADGQSIGTRGVFGTFGEALIAAEDEDEITGPLDLDHIYHTCDAKDARHIYVHWIAPCEKEQ